MTQRVGPNIIPPPPRKPEPAQTRQLQEFKHSSPLLACRFDPTGQHLFFSAQDNSVQRVELTTGKVTPLAGQKSWVRSLAFHPREPVLYAATYDGKIFCWPTTAEKPEPIRVLDAHGGWVRAVAMSPDGKTLASCGNDHLVKLWSAADGKLLHTLKGHEHHVYNVAFHPTGTALVSADLKGTIKQWSLAGDPAASPMRELDAKVLWKYDETFRADIGGIRSMAFSPDGQLLACGGITDVTNAFAGVGKPAVALFDWQTGQRKQLLRPKEDFQGLACGLAFHPDGYLIGAGGGNGGNLWFWKPDQAQSFFTLKLPNNARDLTLHPDNRRLAVAFFDNMARVFTMAGKA